MNALPQTQIPDTQIDIKNPHYHDTVVEVGKHNREIRGRTIEKIRDFLRPMYRQDLRTDILTLLWNGDQLEWDDSVDQFLKTPRGDAYPEGIRFRGRPKDVTAWVGIRLDDFDVSHTKDDIPWLMKDVCADYIVVARTRRKTKDDERGPSELEVQTAIDEMRQEVTSAEFVDKPNLETVPPSQVIAATFEALEKATESETPVIPERIAGISVAVYLEALSVNDPYVAVDAAHENEVAVIVNMPTRTSVRSRAAWAS